jgi:hypothetical protein
LITTVFMIGRQEFVSCVIPPGPQIADDVSASRIWTRSRMNAFFAPIGAWVSSPIRA